MHRQRPTLMGEKLSGSADMEELKEYLRELQTKIEHLWGRL